MPVRCLVTGASGFIGSRLTRRLRDAGYEVRCLVRATSDVSALERLDVELFRGDLTNAATVSGAAADCRCVVHCGALVSDWAGIGEIRAVNVTGTRNLLETAVTASVERVVHISTTDVYGHPGTRVLSERQTPGNFANWYAQSKREAEAEVWRFAGTGALQTTVLRPATVYGPGSKEVVGEISKAICRGQMLMVDGGRAIAGLVYIENLLDAVLLALDAEGAAGATYNVTDGLDVTWRQFLGNLAGGLGHRQPRLSLPYRPASALAMTMEQGYRALHRATGLTTPALLSRQAVQVLGRNQDFSNAAIRTALGWKPRVDYPAGLAATLAWLREEYLPAAGLSLD
jgi:nucleoside-diphosphate-sugar epimerase